jgi:hypothetical protein
LASKPVFFFASKLTLDRSVLPSKKDFVGDKTLTSDFNETMSNVSEVDSLYAFDSTGNASFTCSTPIKTSFSENEKCNASTKKTLVFSPQSKIAVVPPVSIHRHNLRRTYQRCISGNMVESSKEETMCSTTRTRTTRRKPQQGENDQKKRKRESDDLTSDDLTIIEVKPSPAKKQRPSRRYVELRLAPNANVDGGGDGQGPVAVGEMTFVKRRQHASIKPLPGYPRIV